MRHRLRILFAVVIALTPGFALRHVLYRLMLGYRLAPSARIGWRTIVAVRDFEAADGVFVDRYNVFRGPMTVRLARGARIGRLNRFTCPWSVAATKNIHKNYEPALDMGEDSLIVDRHEFDLYGTAYLGARSCFAGYGSKLWTHGLTVMDRDIRIGDDTYIGAGSHLAPGSSLGRANVVALASVVLSKITVEEHLVGGNPARPLWSISDEIAAGRYHRSLGDW